MMHEMMGPEDEDAVMFLHHFVHDIDRLIGKPKRVPKTNPETHAP
jgi:hypothetical protein